MAPWIDEPVPSEADRERALSDVALRALGGAGAAEVRRSVEAVAMRHLDARVSGDGRTILGGRALTAVEAEFARRLLSILDHGRSLDDLRFRASHDTLTGLPNRAELQRLLRPAEPHAQPSGVLVCDLDGLKELNDRHGHRLGDGALVAVANRISHACRSHDLVIRTGGDEFVVICPDASEDVVAGVAARIDEAVAQPLRLGEVTVRTSISIGTAVGAPDEPLVDVLDRADLAMYRVKARRHQRFRRPRPAALPGTEPASLPLADWLAPARTC